MNQLFWCSIMFLEMFYLSMYTIVRPLEIYAQNSVSQQGTLGGTGSSVFKMGRRGLFGECLWKNEVAQKKIYKLKDSKTICPVICSTSGFSASQSLGLVRFFF